MRNPARFFVLAQAFSLLLGFSLLCSAPAQAFTPPQVRQFVLPNGHRVYIVENHNQPSVTIDTWIPAGSVYETKSNNGVSHFLEHLLFKGTEQFETGAIERLLDGQGARYNAGTSQDFTHYYMSVPSSYLEEALALQASMLKAATLPTDELNRERLVVQEEINRSKGQPQSQLFELLGQKLYEDFGYGQTTLGPKEVIAEIPRESILDYYHYWYRPERFATVITGDINTEAALTTLRAAFAAIDSKQKPKTSDYRPPQIGTPKALTFPTVTLKSSPLVSEVLGIIAFRAPSMVDEPEEVVALDAAFTALGDTPSSRLVKRLRNEEKLVTSIESGNMTQRYGGVLYVLFETEAQKLEAATAAILEELQAMLQEGITEAELQQVKQQFAKEFVFLTEDNEKLASTIGYNVSLGKLSDFTQYLDRLNALDTQTVHKALNKWVNLNQTTLVGLLPEARETQSTLASVNAPSQKRSTLFKRKSVAQAEDASNEGSNKPVSATDLQMALQTQLDVASTWNAKADNQALAQQARASEEKPDGGEPFLAEAKTLDNGIRFLKKALPQQNTFSVQLFIPGGDWSEAEPGLGSLYASTLATQTERFSEEALNRLLTQQGIKLNVSSEANATRISLTATSTDLGEALLILDEVLFRPSFEADIVARERKLLVSRLKTAMDNPSHQASVALLEALYPPKHPYGHAGERVLRHLPGLTAADVQRHHRKQLQAKRWIVSAAGNLDWDLLEQYFSQLKLAPGTEWQWEKVTAKAPALPEPATKEIKRDEQPAYWITYGWHVPGVEHPDAAALRVIHGILGNGMSSRLFVNLREKQGLAYAVSSSYPLQRQDGLFQVIIGTDKSNRDTVLKQLQEEVQRLSTEPIGSIELKAVQDKLVGQYKLGHEGPPELAYYAGLYEAVGLGYGFEKQFEAAIRSVTAEDIERVAKKYLSGEPTRVIVGPDHSKLKAKASDKE